MEGLAPFHNLHRVGAPILIVNGAIAFCLNVAGVFLIDSAGSLVLTLSGVGKVSPKYSELMSGCSSYLPGMVDGVLHHLHANGRLLDCNLRPNVVSVNGRVSDNA